jgi:hypothetical protein
MKEYKFKIVHYTNNEKEYQEIMNVITDFEIRNLKRRERYEMFNMWKSNDKKINRKNFIKSC